MSYARRPMWWFFLSSLVLLPNALATPAAAQGVDELLWGDVETPEGGVLGGALLNWLETGASEDHLSVEVEAARRAFWEARRSGTGLREAARDFQARLRDKDLWYVVHEVLSEIYGGSDVTFDPRSIEAARGRRRVLEMVQGGPVDGGIPASTTDEWIDFIDAVMQGWTEAAGDDVLVYITRPDLLLSAVNEPREEYEVYREARDLVEIWRAHLELGVGLPDRSDRELLQLHLRTQNPIDRWEEAGEVYDRLVELLGRPSVDGAFQAFRSSGTTTEGVDRALAELDRHLTPRDPGAYVQWLLMRIPGQQGEMSGSGWLYAERFDYAADRWDEIQKALPTERIEEAVRAVQQATETPEGFIRDPSALGLFVSDRSQGAIPDGLVWVQTPTPRRVLAALLTPDEPLGYARMLMFEAQWAGSRPPRTTFEELVSWYGEEAVEGAAAEVAGMRRNGFGALLQPDGSGQAGFPAQVFRKLLASSNPRGYVREVLALQHEREREEPLEGVALDAAYAELVGEAGSEERVLQQTRKVVEGVRARELERLDGYDQIVLRLRPAENNNPDYIAWEGYPEGTVARYSVDDTRPLTRSRGIGRSDATLGSVRGLLTVRLERANITSTVIGARQTTRMELSGRFEARPPAGQEEEYRRFEAAIHNRYRPEMEYRFTNWEEHLASPDVRGLPGQYVYGTGVAASQWNDEGTDTFEMSGGSHPCRIYEIPDWERVCLSDEVPGQVVYHMRFSDTGVRHVRLTSFEIPGQGRVEVSVAR